MSEPILLRVEGHVEQALSLTYADLAAMPEDQQVRDVSRFQPTRAGDGVALDALLERCGPRPEADFVTLHADRDDFHVSVALSALRGQGVVVYRLGEGPLPAARGGPIRLLIRDPAACHAGELDDCANVKYLDRIELTARRGRDTRPTDDASHAELHTNPGEAFHRPESA